MGTLYDGSTDRNMDGGWGWVVLGASFILFIVANGSSYTFGVIFVELLADFKAGEAVTSYIGSLQAALMDLTGLFAGPLGKAVGWRPISIAGGIMSGIGFGLSALAPNIFVLYLTCGVLTGIGNGFMHATSVLCFHGFFDKYRTMASGIISSGSGLGVMAFSLLANYLLTHYNWRITFAVYGVIVFVVGITCGLLLKPPSSKFQKSNGLLNTDTDFQRKEPSYSSHSHNNKSSAENNKPFYGSIDDTDSLETHLDYNQGSSHTHRMQSLSIHSKQTEAQQKVGELNPRPCFKLRGVAQTLKNILDFSLLRNPIQFLFATTFFSFPFGYHVVYTYIPERALWFGLSRTKAASLMTVLGFSNTVFRVVTGCIGNKFPRFQFYMVGLACLGMGVLNMMISLFDSYPAMIMFTIMYGLVSGTLISIIPVLLVDTLGIDNIEKSLGICMMFAAMGFMLASPMAGFIIQMSGDINLPFEVVGIIGILGAAAYFCILCLIPKYGVKHVK